MDGDFQRCAMVPAYGTVWSPQNPGTGNGQIPGCSFILTYGSVVGNITPAGVSVPCHPGTRQSCGPNVNRPRCFRRLLGGRGSTTTQSAKPFPGCTAHTQTRTRARSPRALPETAPRQPSSLSPSQLLPPRRLAWRCGARDGKARHPRATRRVSTHRVRAATKEPAWTRRVLRRALRRGQRL